MWGTIAGSTPALKTFLALQMVAISDLSVKSGHSVGLCGTEGLLTLWHGLKHFVTVYLVGSGSLRSVYEPKEPTVTL